MSATELTHETERRSAVAHIRRARRTDFTAVMQLLAASGVSIPPPDRLTLRRFRNLVNDLGTDFYLALVDGAPVGLVHVTYARQLSAPPSARVEQLLVAESLRRRGVGQQLLRLVERRAHQRGCAAVSCIVHSDEATPFLATAGFQSAGALWRRAVETGDH